MVNDRIGSKITVRSINLKAKLSSLEPLAVDSHLGIFMVVDHRDDSTAPGYGSIFDVQQQQLYRNLKNYKRFSVYPVKTLRRDLVYDATANTNAVNSANSISFTWYKRFKHGMRVEFEAQSGTDVSKNATYLVLWSFDTDATIDITGNCRVTYTEE